MERKSMGSFITALRKANGLTQKDLAEKLNISDKTISRWERDENAPDLSVIPVLAEIFNVTCDELLCGERKIAPAQSEGDSPRKAKQMKRILEESIHKFENHSYIAMTISALGVVGGLLANFGFLEANIGFFVSLIFFVIATVYQCIASNNMTYRMNSDEFEPAQLQPYKMRQFNGNKRSFLWIVTPLFVISPLIVVVDGAYVGLSAEAFALFALLILLILVVVYKLLVEGLLTKIALKKGIYLESAAIAKQQKLQRLKNKSAALTAIVCVVVLLVQVVYMSTCSAKTFSTYTAFTNFDDFVAYMTIETEREFYDEYGATSVAPSAAVGDTIYYDENGNVITEEQARTETIEDSDGNVVCTYQHNNRAVISFSIAWDGDTLAEIRTYTQSDWQDGAQRYNQYGNMLNFGYPLAVCIGFVYYFSVRKKYAK